MNLMEDKETILLSHKNCIEKLKIENNKLIHGSMIYNVYINIPGIIINYENQYAWANSTSIGFINQDYYNLNELAKQVKLDDSIGYKLFILNIFRYKNDILFIFGFYYYDYEGEFDQFVKFG